MGEIVFCSRLVRIQVDKYDFAWEVYERESTRIAFYILISIKDVTVEGMFVIAIALESVSFPSFKTASLRMSLAAF